MPLFELGPALVFPAPERAMENGLLAIGGDLSRERLLLAYQMGIFPWFSADDPLLWWSPDPRLVLFPDRLHVSRSLEKTIRQSRFNISFDADFSAVISQCARTRQTPGGEGTWITAEMMAAYIDLHKAGVAHSVEAWQGGRLVGGLYGICLGRSFFGESMFSLVSNASKVAFVTLVRRLQAARFDLVDCQVSSPHLLRFGAVEIPRARFLARLRASVSGDWQAGWSEVVG